MTQLTDLVARPPSLLRRALLAAAVISGATGLLMLLGAGVLTELLGLPAALLRYAGLILLPYAVLLGALAAQDAPSRRGVWAVVGANALWAAGCALLLVTGWIAPTWLGYAFVLVQAVVVALFAEHQFFGLRRARLAIA